MRACFSREIRGRQLNAWIITVHFFLDLTQAESYSLIEIPWAWDSSMSKSFHLFNPSASTRKPSKHPLRANFPIRSHHSELQETSLYLRKAEGSWFVPFCLHNSARATFSWYYEFHVTNSVAIFAYLYNFCHTQLLKVASARAIVRQERVMNWRQQWN